jgi:hypothetical protein
MWPIELHLRLAATAACDAVVEDDVRLPLDGRARALMFELITYQSVHSHPNSSENLIATHLVEILEGHGSKAPCDYECDRVDGLTYQ